MVVAGSVNADIVVRAERLPRPGETVSGREVAWHAGGKGANQAAAAALAGAPTRFIGCVGSDDHGRRLVEVLTGFGVEVVTRVVEGPSGQAYITVDGRGENHIVVVPGANAALAAGDVDGVGLTAHDVALAVLESPAEAVLAFLRAARPARRILNPTPVERCTPALLAEADVVVVNEHEYDRLQPEHPGLVVTLGAGGVRVGEVTIAGVPATAVDTTGAGDCFVGTLGARLALGDDLVAAARAANAAAARSITRPGAMESYR